MQDVRFDVLQGLDAGDIESLKYINGSLSRLRKGLLAKLEVEGILAESKLAWKLRVFQEVMTYRMVALGESLALSWNAENQLGAYLPARAIIETLAVSVGVELDVKRYTDARDLGAINALLTNRIFATRDAGWIEEAPDSQSVNVLTLVSKLQDKLIPNIRQQYDYLSERCHPNYLGHHAMFSTLDVETGTTTFSRGKDVAQNRNMVFTPMLLIGMFENHRNRITEMLPSVADLQRR